MPQKPPTSTLPYELTIAQISETETAVQKTPSLTLNCRGGHADPWRPTALPSRTPSRISVVRGLPGTGSPRPGCKRGARPWSPALGASVPARQRPHVATVAHSSVLAVPGRRGGRVATEGASTRAPCAKLNVGQRQGSALPSADQRWRRSSRLWGRGFRPPGENKR